MAIIPQISSNVHPKSWQSQLKDAFTEPAALLEYLQLDSKYASVVANKQFGLRVPQSFASKMEKGNIDDPLLRQVLPINDELAWQSGFTYDPLQESQVNPHPGLLHKYNNRILLTIAGACAINCRYCFRRHFPYNDNHANHLFDNTLSEYLQKNPQINEVILSGGDPLLISDQKLQAIIQYLSSTKRIDTLRIHTRLPVVIAERITQAFLSICQNAALKIVLVLHVNHPNEIDNAFIEKMKSCQQANITLLNQSVLLKGVNDDIETLVSLSETLFKANIMPYYLHLLDKVHGTVHFEVNIATAKALHEQLKQRLSGYLVPRLVTEVAHQQSKTWIA